MTGTDIEKQRVIVSHVRNDNISYLKGFFDFICNINKSAENKKIFTIINNIICCSLVFLLFTIPYGIAKIMIFYNKIPHIKHTIYDNIKPSEFDETRGDHCTTDYNGIIVKCHIHNDDIIVMYSMGILIMMFGFVFIAIAFSVIMLSVEFFKTINITACYRTCLKQCTDTIDIIKALKNQYNIFRNEIKQKVDDDDVIIV